MNGISPERSRSWVLALAALASFMPANQSASMGSVSVEQMGKATGAYGVGQFLGGVAGIALGTTAVALLGSYESQASFIAGFSGAIWTTASMAFVGSVWAGLLVPGRRARGALAPAQ